MADLPPHKPTDGWGGAKARAYSNVHIEPWSVSVRAKPDPEAGTAAAKIKANILNRYFEEKSVRTETEIMRLSVFLLMKLFVTNMRRLMKKPLNLKTGGFIYVN